ncbi:unnamed protein product [Rhizophagus irregularis]|nr:unnamed protein product [Rhizophagus irregularis]
MGIFTNSCIYLSMYKISKETSKKLGTKYEPIPFVSGRTKNVTLEERVQSIENILKEYYLDTDFFEFIINKRQNRLQ